MSSRSAAGVSALVLGCSVLGQAGAAPQQTPFQARTDAVVVPVSVMADSRPLTGLVAADFHLTDDGVQQTVELAPVENVPLDVELVVQTSASVKDPDRLWADLKTVNGLLGANDRIGLMTYGSTVRERVPLQPVSVPVAAQSVEGRGPAVILDALLQALVRPGAPSRVHIIVLATDGIDVSVSRPEDLIAVASHSDAVVETAVTGNTYLHVPDPAAPKQKPAPVLNDISSVTGGTAVRVDDLVDAFKRAIDTFRHGYVLTYIATEVPRAGWHTISVTLVRSGNYRVLARHGYMR
jgi:hypothetical protein